MGGSTVLPPHCEVSEGEAAPNPLEGDGGDSESLSTSRSSSVSDLSGSGTEGTETPNSGSSGVERVVKSAMDTLPKRGELSTAWGTTYFQAFGEQPKSAFLPLSAGEGTSHTQTDSSGTSRSEAMETDNTSVVSVASVETTASTKARVRNLEQMFSERLDRIEALLSNKK